MQKKTMGSSKNIQGLCEWCGKPLVEDVVAKVADDYICTDCYWGYRNDRHQIHELRKGISCGI